MATAKSPTTPTQGTTHHTHDHHQAELLFRATNHLALALFLLRNASGESSIKTATGQANAAARTLNQLSGSRA